MDFSWYEAAAARTAPSAGSRRETLLLAGLGLAGEAGEVADHIKKVAFHAHDLDADHVAEELGDILWYAALAARAIGVTLADVAAMNIRKLERRYPEGFSSERSRKREGT
ncbi:MAG: nucleoside triphosphate pyrophosphohydrolase family protein [Candidatus Limnocylindria bacterium]